MTNRNLGIDFDKLNDLDERTDTFGFRIDGMHFRLFEKTAHFCFANVNEDIEDYVFIAEYGGEMIFALPENKDALLTVLVEKKIICVPVED